MQRPSSNERDPSDEEVVALRRRIFEIERRNRSARDNPDARAAVQHGQASPPSHLPIATGTSTTLAGPMSQSFPHPPPSQYPLTRMSANGDAPPPSQYSSMRMPNDGDAPPPPSQYSSTRMPATGGSSAVLSGPRNTTGDPSGSVGAQIVETRAPFAPVTNAYPGIAMQNAGHPAPFMSFQLFAGINTLVPPSNTREVNRARRASALTIPGSRNAELPRRGRGPAIRAPRLPIGNRRLTMDDCLVPGADHPTAKVTIKVYPPKDDHNFLLYRKHRVTLAKFMESECLLYAYEVPLAKSMVSVIADVCRDMEINGFIFSLANSSMCVAHEALPLRLLEVVNQGKPRRKSNAIFLRASDISALDTLEMLVTRDKKRIALPMCLETGRLEFFLYAVRSPLERQINNQIHTCLSANMYAIFLDDECLDQEASRIYEDGLCPCDTDGESTTSSQSQPLAGASGAAGSRTLALMSRLIQDKAELDEVDQLLNSQWTPGNVSNNQARVHSPPPSSILNRQALTAPQHQADVGQQTTTSIIGAAVSGGELWREPWSGGESVAQIFDFEHLKEQIFESIHPNLHAAPVVVIQGSNTKELVDALKVEIKDAIAMNDFSNLLSPARSFEVVDSEGELISYGEGIEREIIFQLFLEYTGIRNKAKWLVEQADGMHTLQILMSAGDNSNETRLRELQIFGVICAFMMIEGQAPEPLDPLILYCKAHNLDLRSLYESIVAAWHPELRQVIKAWQDAGAQGNIHFAESILGSYVGVQAAALEGHDESTHQTFAMKMLVNTIFGLGSLSGPEWSAFFSGFDLPCKDGFRFGVAIRSVKGGPEMYFNCLWSAGSRGFDALRSVLSVENPPERYMLRIASVARPNGAPGHPDFKALIGAFLSGSGVPVDALFDDLKHTWDSVIDLSQISTPGFRAKLLVWATTGSPYVVADKDIKVKFVDDDDDLYFIGRASPESRAALIAAGTICFRTCLRRAYVPASYVVKLAERDYQNVPNGQPTSFKMAFEHWILVELLTSIGQHSIV